MTDDSLIFAVEPGGAEIELLRAGRYVRGGEPLEITEADLDRAIENFIAEGREVALDYDHSFSHGREAPAAGWIRELIRRGRSLFARVRWTPRAAQLIEDEEYRGISAEFSHRAKDEFGNDRGFTVLGGGLTNRPFLRGLAPVTLSDRTSEVEALVAEIEALAARDDVDPAAFAEHRAAVALMVNQPSLNYETALAAVREESR